MALPAGRYGVTRAMLDFLKGGGSGGDYDIISDEVLTSSSEPTSVNLGFSPDILLVFASKNTNDMFHVFCKEWKTNKQIRCWDFGSYTNNVILWDLPYTGADTTGIKSIDDAGFTLLPYSGDYTTDGKVSYIAIRKKS